jgi:uncharacterized protein YuzB (UPF0349 family)
MYHCLTPPAVHQATSFLPKILVFTLNNLAHGPRPHAFASAGYQPNQAVLDALSRCIAACELCATACLQEDDVQMMVPCIRLDRDCADICRLTAAFIARGSDHARHVFKECLGICRKCAEACRACVAY